MTRTLPAPYPDPVMKHSPERKIRETSIKRRVFSAPTLVSFGVAAGFILFLATRFDLDWSETWSAIRGINPWLYLVGVLLYYLSFIFRGARWRILATNAATGDNPKIPSAPRAAQLIIIGWFVNSVTWLRLGDAYRAYAFAEDTESSFSWSLGTLLAERVMDMVIVAAVLVIAAVALTAGSGHAMSGYIVAAALAMATGIVAVTLLMKIYGERAARWLPGRVKSAYERFRQGALGSFGQLPAVMALGVAGWIFEMGRLYMVLLALGLDTSLALIPVVALGHAVLSTVPTPGGVGAVEPGVTGLLLIELSQPEAAAATIVDRSITYLSIIAVGGALFLLRQALRARGAVSGERAAAKSGSR